MIISLEEKFDKLTDLLEKIERNTRFAPNGGYVEKEEKEEISTSGAGAFLGMVIGALLGLTSGGTGVLIGGILGGIIGDALEYEAVKENINNLPLIKLLVTPLYTLI